MNWKTKFVTVKLVVVVVVVGDNISTTTTTENCQTIWYHESKTKLIMWWQLENWISISTQAKKKKTLHFDLDLNTPAQLIQCEKLKER